jgi:dipeptidyl aminopeptidase/acylaminoacyl peptidase
MRGTIGIVICLLLSSTLAAEERTKPSASPLEQFTRYPAFQSVKLSPDGQYAALVTGQGKAVGFITVSDKKLLHASTMSQDFVIDDLYWVSPDRVIFTLAERELGNQFPSSTGEIFGIDRDGKRLKFLYGYRAGELSTGTHMQVRESSFAWPELIPVHKRDDRTILIAEHPFKLVGHFYRPDHDAKPTATRVDVFDGNKRTIAQAPLANTTFIVDRDDQVRFAIGENEKFKLAVSWKADADSPWTAFELPGFGEGTVIPQIFGTDNQSVIFTAIPDGAQYSALYSVNLKSKAVSKLYAFDDTDIQQVVTDFAGNEVIGVLGGGNAGPVAAHWLDESNSAARLYTGLFKAFPGQRVVVTGTDDDGQHAVVFVYSDVNPGDYYLFDIKKKTADYLLSTRHWIEPEEMHHKEPFAMKARDGLELHGYITKPSGTGPFPLVVLPHGGPYGIHDGWEFEPRVQMLASAGYAVLQVNFRGSDGYGAAFEEAGYLKWGREMQDDVTDATHWAIDQKITQADRICIFGGSYGGYAALMGAIREPQLYRCAIGESGVYDLELMQSSGDIRYSRSGKDYLLNKIGSDPADLHARSPAYNADKIQIPILLIHGKADWRADFDQATQMKAALDKNHKKYEWLALRGEGHGVFNEQTRLEVAQRIVSFLEANLDVKR